MRKGLLLREAARKLGVAARLADCLHDRRASEKVRHTIAEMIRFRRGPLDGAVTNPVFGDHLDKTKADSYSLKNEI